MNILQNNFIENKFPLVGKLIRENQIGIGVYSVPNLILIDTNQVYTENFSEPFNSVESALGCCIDEFVEDYSISSIKETFQSAIKTRKSIHLKEYQHSCNNLRNRYVDESIVPIVENEQVKFLISMIFDVTEKVNNKRNEKEMLASIIKMKDEFMYNISHEFKTPLNVIISAVQALEIICKDEVSDRAMTFIKKIKQNCLREIRMVNNLLDITKINNGYAKFDKTNIDIVEVTQYIVKTIHPYSQQKKICIEFLSDLENEIIAIDEEKYKRVLLNLISNSIKFTQKGKNIFIKVFKESNMICIQVKDEGIGIPKDKYDLIFECFGQVDTSLTRKAEGTGAGLHLVKMFVEGMDGDITLKSEEGIGSIFTLRFPSTKIKESPDNVCKRVDKNSLIEAICVEFSDIYF
jgi:signal transduction histidine kinase